MLWAVLITSIHTLYRLKAHSSTAKAVVFCLRPHKIYRMQYVLEEIPAASEANNLAFDLGCGAGIFIPALKEKGYNVTAIDISSEMISMAR